MIEVDFSRSYDGRENLFEREVQIGRETVQHLKLVCTSRENFKKANDHNRRNMTT